MGRDNILVRWQNTNNLTEKKLGIHAGMGHQKNTMGENLLTTPQKKRYLLLTFWYLLEGFSVHATGFMSTKGILNLGK